jgi:uncharacterized membrane protein
MKLLLCLIIALGVYIAYLRDKKDRKPYQRRK